MRRTVRVAVREMRVAVREVRVVVCVAKKEAVKVRAGWERW